MSKQTYLIGAMLVLVATCASACSSARSSTPPRSSVASKPAAPWPCLVGFAFEQHRLSGRFPVTVVTLGSGPRAVVLSNQSDQDLCSWLPLARTLADRGYRVALYDYALTADHDAAAVATYLRAHAAGRVALVGASEGAKASLVVGATLTPAPTAVVSLSAEEYLHADDVAPYVTRLRAPTLFVAASGDASAIGPTRGFYGTAPAGPKKLLVRPGTAHGTDLLNDPVVVAALTHFLDAHA